MTGQNGREEGALLSARLPRSANCAPERVHSTAYQGPVGSNSENHGPEIHMYFLHSGISVFQASLEDEMENKRNTS